MKIGELRADDRVEFAVGVYAKAPVQGRVLEVSASGRRILVRWDAEEGPGAKQGAGHWINAKPLRRLPLPELMSFCAWCLIGIGPRELTVSNSRNGVTFHIRCARVIAQATNDHDKTVYGLTHESWPAKGEVNEAIEREAESKEQGR